MTPEELKLQCYSMAGNMADAIKLYQWLTEDAGLREVRAYTSGSADGYQMAMATLRAAPAEPEAKPESEVIGYFISDGRSVQMHADGAIAPLRADEPSQAPTSSPSTDEARSVTPATEEECGDHIEASVQSEPVGSLQDETEMPSSPGEGEESRDQFDDEPESGLHADPEPTELDAPTSIVDDPELLAAVARAEATLAQEEPAYVGLQDPELDAEYEAMREREKADKPKLHFSIFGERGNRKLEEV